MCNILFYGDENLILIISPDINVLFDQSAVGRDLTTCFMTNKISSLNDSYPPLFCPVFLALFVFLQFYLQPPLPSFVQDIDFETAPCNINNKVCLAKTRHISKLYSPSHIYLKECSDRGGEMEHIAGARFILQGHKILNSNDESKLVHELREICHASKYNVTVFHPYFIYFDQVMFMASWLLANLTINVIISVSCGAPDHNPVRGHRGGRDDVRLPDLHP